MIDHYIQRLSDKGFEIYDVRRELEQQKIDDEEIKIIVRAVDEELQTRLLTVANQNSSPQFVRIGVILMLVGIGLGLTALVGIINPGNFFIFIYGCFFGGLSVLLVGLIKRKKMTSKKSSNQSNEPPDRRRVSFRKTHKDK